MFSFMKKSPASLSDEELEAVAAARVRWKDALDERERRQEARRLAAVARAAEAADGERKKRVAELHREHGRHADELRCAHAGLVSALDAAGAALTRRDEASRRLWDVEAALQRLGAPAPSVDRLPAPHATTVHVQRLRPILHREFCVDPLADAVAANPEAFR